MSTLNIKTSGGIKSYELKDSADTPRIAVRTSSGTKYLRLKEGSKAGELNVGVPIWISDSRMVTVPHYIFTFLEPEEAVSQRAAGLSVSRSQKDADNYDWVLDPENRKVYCEENNITYQTGSSPDASKQAHSYASNQWGGTGPMHLKHEPDSQGRTYAYTVTTPFYFLWGDNPEELISGGSGHAASTLCDVYKNGSSLKQYKSSNTPILFDEGDTIEGYVWIGGYNTQDGSGAAAYVATWVPVIRPAEYDPDYYSQNKLMLVTNSSSFQDVYDQISDYGTTTTNINGVTYSSASSGDKRGLIVDTRGWSCYLESSFSSGTIRVQKLGKSAGDGLYVLAKETYTVFSAMQRMVVYEINSNFMNIVKTFIGPESNA